MSKDFLPTDKWRQRRREEYLSKYKGITVSVVGKSILGKDIDCYKIGSGARCIVAVGAHHAMEYISALALYDFLDFILEKSTRGETYCGINLQYLTERNSYFIIPCLNPDGVDMRLVGTEGSPLRARQVKMNGGSDNFSDWQANARGVDLNHNYGAGFFEYKKIEAEEGIFAGKTRFSGEYPESEPETRALARFIRTLSPAAVVSLHTQGAEIFSKPEDEHTTKVAERICRRIGYKKSVPQGYAAYGGLCDYTGDVLGIPSFTVELGRGESPLPDSALEGICDAVRRLLALLPTYL